MKFIGIVTVIAVSMVATAIWSGYVLSILWGWFIVTSLGCPPLSVPSAIGIACVVGYLTHPKPPDTPEGKFAEGLTEAIVYALLNPAFALFFGWIVHYWV